MLDPEDRCLLLDSLRPPEGYALDAAIGTTFTLDLMALLTAPLAFTFFEFEEQDGRPSAHPLALFEAARRAAQKMHIFCHGGGIKVPPANRRLLPLIEDCLVQVLPDREGAIFHPKIWLLRYENPEHEAAYRFLCLSRNLTFDRAWDTALVLDGVVGEPGDDRGRNEPLARFLRRLPEWAVGEAPARTRHDIERMAAELDHVRFEAPPGFTRRGLRFHPLGLDANPDDAWPFSGGSRRSLVISPFLTTGFLERFLALGGATTLISRPEALDEVEADTLARFDQIYVFDEGAEAEESLDEATPEAETPAHDQQGLHAKLFITEQGQGRVFTGSANATSPAFGGGIEFLVELATPRAANPIDDLLGPEDNPSLGLQRVLVPWQRAPRGIDNEEQLRRALEQRIDAAARRILASGAHLAVEAKDAEAFALALVQGPRGLDLPEGLELCAWPASLDRPHAQTVQPGEATLVRFAPVSFAALTAFLGFEASLEQGGIRCTSRFVLKFPLVGAPANRRERLLRDLIEDRDHLMRFIALLLDRGGLSVRTLAAAAGLPNEAAGDGPGRKSAPDFPLLEGLLKAADHEPKRLDEVAALVADLLLTDAGRELVPPALEQLLEAFMAVREELAS